ncbi:Piso0_005215 [Millerozyma farinosa CBS 7064]|uniref:Piso0_005215 protein n=1 Tax=Pichia sorbitophila (strain ATCC MYA-4447 / BCRC 22081 / CBS 7064 / NBRC 10061 / NRRL Y-12695) TaxID=559304 RepID=G8Y1K6_PICSO|nr:Piso0_005215 [Millerozyma farinosa CBS 7064]
MLNDDTWTTQLKLYTAKSKTVENIFLVTNIKMGSDEQIPVWLDCDPGNDDAFAIMLAAFHPKFNLVGISTVYGNAPLSDTTHNTLALLEVFGVQQDEIKVYAGSERPLAKEPRFATMMHGSSGIGGADLPTTTRLRTSTDQTYLDAMRTAILEHSGKICVVCTGCLTNFASLIQKYPEVKDKIRYISAMGGAFGFGNITPTAEYNVYCDPVAAKVVLNEEKFSGKIVLAPLNITHKAIATSEIRNKLYDESNPAKNSILRRKFFSILMYFAENYRIHRNMVEGPPLHDPLAMFCLIPVIYEEEGITNDINFKYIKSGIDITLTGEHEGETKLSTDPASCEILIGDSINIAIFWQYILEALDNADRYSKIK